MEWIELMNERSDRRYPPPRTSSASSSPGFGAEDDSDFEVKVMFQSGRGSQKWTLTVPGERCEGALVKGETLRLTNTDGPGSGRLEGEHEEWGTGRHDLPAGAEPRPGGSSVIG